MKKIILGALLFLSTTAFGQIIYVSTYNGTYPILLPWANGGTVTINTDMNIDSDPFNYLEFSLKRRRLGLPITSGWFMEGTFTGSWAMGFNVANGPYGGAWAHEFAIQPGSISAHDCTGDTIGYTNLTWNKNAEIYFKHEYQAQYDSNIDFGLHKLGFRIACEECDSGGVPHWKYGYINYSFLEDWSIVIHGVYYENTINEPIIATSSLTLDELSNAILVYPNPANSHITIDNENFSIMNGCSITIKNSTGQSVFQSVINQQQFYVDLSTWGGSGLYFMHLINAQGLTTDIKKIILQ